MPASKTVPASDNRFQALTPASLSKPEKSSVVTLALKVLSQRYRPRPRVQLARGHRRVSPPQTHRAAQRGVRHHVPRHQASPDRNRRALPGHRRRGGRIPESRRSAGAREERRGHCGISQPPLKRRRTQRGRPHHHAEAQSGPGTDRRAPARSPSSSPTGTWSRSRNAGLYDRAFRQLFARVRHRFQSHGCQLRFAATTKCGVFPLASLKQDLTLRPSREVVVDECCKLAELSSQCSVLFTQGCQGLLAWCCSSPVFMLPFVQRVHYARAVAVERGTRDAGNLTQRCCGWFAGHAVGSVLSNQLRQRPLKSLFRRYVISHGYLPCTWHCRSLESWSGLPRVGCVR